MRILCNPLNISYKYQHMKYSRFAFREGADPTLIYFKDKYYLFVSMCAGFYYSDDLINWKYHKNSSVDMFAYAPDVSTDGEYMYLCASHRFGKSGIYKSKNPLKEDFELVSQPFAFWDPHLNFESGKPYLFWGCSNRTPIYQIELDNCFLPVGDKKLVIAADKENHGAERKTMFLTNSLIDRILGDNPFMEGVYCNRLGDKYYLQYACPGTEYPTYNDSVYVSDCINGKYQYQQHNPFSIVPSGFAVGAGHGSTIADKHGNLWHASTIGVCVNHSYERRAGLWCAGVDNDGILYCNQSFSDYPKEIPAGKFNPLDIKPKWMLLSYKARVTVSSFFEEYLPENAVDESIKTCWCAETSNADEWFKVDLGEVKNVCAVQINFADVRIPKMKLSRKKYKGTLTLERFIDTSYLNKTQWKLLGSKDNNEWKIIQDKSNADTDLSHDFVVLDNEKQYRYLKLEFVSCPYNQKFAISGFRVFGIGNGKRPESVIDSVSKRLSKTDAMITWDKIDNAQGYNVNIGIAPDKLYTSILIYDNNRCDITFLNGDVKIYYYRIDSFNENGVTQGKICKIV